MKKKLIILSDLWGKENSDWIKNYTSILNSQFDIEYYDCCDLAEINKYNYTQDNLHKQFIDGGIERAVESLIKNENSLSNILAFSIGGTIAWKFALKTDLVNSLICISSTRLRYESIRPKGEINLYYGENDPFKPPNEWLDKMKLKYFILRGKEHQFYMEPEFAKHLHKDWQEKYFGV